ncbi:hypothetical protein AXA44_36585 [Rhodococcus sp. SC4]|nr:hypothetical protein AXA44_36585 [Rhodococcus sp. SC4]
MDEAINAIQAGFTVVLIDEDAIEGGCELVAAAALVTTATMHFIIRHTSGFVTVALPEARCDQLRLPAFACGPEDWCSPVPAVAADATEGVSTGISAVDRAHTARLLADPYASGADFTRPGHVVPLRIPVQVATGRTPAPATAALHLCTLAGLPAAVRCELVHDEGELRDPVSARAFAEARGLITVRTKDLL